MLSILVVDDSSFMRGAIKYDLVDMDCNFIEASSGEEAVCLYKDHRPALVIMDYTMCGMSGVDALKAIREYDISARVIMCSAMGQNSIVVDAVRAGALDFIVKPFAPGAIAFAVKKYLP